MAFLSRPERGKSKMVPLVVHQRDDMDGGTIYGPLWLACAGPQTSVPCQGDKVFYFPQGHIQQIEEAFNTSHDDDQVEMPIYDLPYKILCKVVDVQLKAEKTEEVYAQISLLPLNDETMHQMGTSSFEDGDSLVEHGAQTNNDNIVYSFFKKLTPSDASTHGGLSISKRNVEQYLPPLDMSQDTPSMDLVAKDLFGKEWNFRHVIRGKPERHLLTCGWSAFVSAKKLVAGDTCILVRKGDELHIGIRRAKTNPLTDCSATVHNMKHGILASAHYAISTASVLTVYYRPWTSPGEFIIPYDRYMNSIGFNYSIGTRFKMPLDEDRRPDGEILPKMTGTIVGVNSIDPFRWPGSNWKCLKVQWDEDASPLLEPPPRPEQVSPWCIEPIEVLQGQESRSNFIPQLENVAFNCLPSKRKVCKLFGVDIENHQYNVKQLFPPAEMQIKWSNSHFQDRTSVKVLKHGSAIGRRVDLTRLSSYDELVCELDRVFDLNGTLMMMMMNGRGGWNVMYHYMSGGRSEWKIIGNCPWQLSLLEENSYSKCRKW